MGCPAEVHSHVQQYTAHVQQYTAHVQQYTAHVQQYKASIAASVHHAGRGRRTVEMPIY
jgi:hypothetical protein